jgi:hypothetical protein
MSKEKIVIDLTEDDEPENVQRSEDEPIEANNSPKTNCTLNIAQELDTNAFSVPSFSSPTGIILLSDDEPESLHSEELIRLSPLQEPILPSTSLPENAGLSKANSLVISEDLSLIKISGYSPEQDAEESLWDFDFIQLTPFADEVMSSESDGTEENHKSMLLSPPKDVVTQVGGLKRSPSPHQLRDDKRIGKVVVIDEGDGVHTDFHLKDCTATNDKGDFVYTAKAIDPTIPMGMEHVYQFNVEKLPMSAAVLLCTLSQHAKL